MNYILLPILLLVIIPGALLLSHFRSGSAASGAGSGILGSALLIYYFFPSAAWENELLNLPSDAHPAHARALRRPAFCPGSGGLHRAFLTATGS